MKMALEAATKLAVFLLWSELSLFFNWFHHNTVNISIFYTKQIALFATAIYNIYNLYPELFISFLYKCGAPHSITIIAI